MVRNVQSLASLVILDGLRRYALIGMVSFSLALELAGLLFFEFIPRDIGRASNDFILSVGWLTGFLFLLFHAVQTISWDEDRRIIHTLLARPISRSQYILGMFAGLSTLLFLLNIIMSFLGLAILLAIKNSVAQIYFDYLSILQFFLSWVGLFCIELIILAVIMLFSGLVRGGFPVLLMTVSYYLVCSGLPVVRSAMQKGSGTIENNALPAILTGLTFVFPDLGRFDLKEFVIDRSATLVFQHLAIDLFLMILYVMLILFCATLVYQKRDLQ